jgi:hypothetical protein
MGIMLALFYALIIVYSIYRFDSLRPKNMHWAIPVVYFFAKCIVGIGLGIFYLKYYGAGDTYGYFSDSGHLFSTLFNEPKQFFKIMLGYHLESPDTARNVASLHTWVDSGFDEYYNDAKTLVKLNTLFRFVSFGYYEVHVVLMALLAYIGLILLYRIFLDEVLPNNKWSWIVSLLVFTIPSHFIWSSGLMKEPLILFVFAFLMYITYLSTQQMRVRYIIYFISILTLFCFVKIYLLLIMLPGILGIYFFRFKKPLIQISFIVLFYTITVSIILFLGNYYSAFDLPALMFGKQLNTYRFAVFMNAGSLVQPISFAPNVTSFLKHFPEASWYAFFHPTLSELKEWWFFPFSLESWIIILFFAMNFILDKGKSYFTSSFCILSLIIAIMLLALVGFTNPVLGNIVRYRMIAMLVLILSSGSTLIKLLNQKYSNNTKEKIEL